MRNSRRGRRQPPRQSIPTALTPRAEWDHPEPDPVATQPIPKPGAAVVPKDPKKVSPEDAAAILARVPACAHCKGHHVRACPRVKSMKFHPNGSLAGVDFWPEGKWSDDHILWPDELVDDE